MTCNEFVESLGERVKFCNEHPTQKGKGPVFKLSMLMDSGPRLRAGKNEQHCPITFLHDQLCNEADEPLQIHEYKKAAQALGLCEEVADIIVSAADNQYLLGEEDNEAARYLRSQLIRACGIGIEKGAAP